MRALDLTRPGFRRDRLALAPRGSPQYKALVRVLDELSGDGPVPGPDDVLVRLPMQVMARPVPGTSLLIAYIAGPDVLTLLALIERQ